MAYQRSQSSSDADIYYANVTSMLSIMKTAVFLVETVVSDMFIVSLSNRFSSTNVLPIRIALSVISVLYRLEFEPPDHGSPSHSVPCRHRYVPPDLFPAQMYTQRIFHLLKQWASQLSTHYRSSGRTQSSTTSNRGSQTHSSPALSL